MNADYEWALEGDAKAYVGGSIRLLGKQSGNYDPVYLATYGRQIMLPSYNVVDLRGGVEIGQYSIEAYVKNLTNAAGRTSTAPAGGFPGNAIGAGVIRPRTIGMTLGLDF